MASSKENKLTLVIKAVDKATGPLKAVTDQIEKATSPIRNFSKEMKRFGDVSGFKNLGTALGGVGSAAKKVGSEAFALASKFALLGGAAAFGFYRIARGAIDSGDALNEHAKRIGFTVDQYAQLQFAAAQSDVSQEDFNGSMDKFNAQLGQLKQGTGPLKALPAVFRQQLSGAKGTRAAFDLAVKSMQKMGSASEKAALARLLFGKSGGQFGQFLDEGSEAIKKQEDRFFELAGSKAKFAAESDKADNALRETTVAFEGLRDTAMAELLPAFTELTKAVTAFIVKNKDGIKKWATETGAALSKWISGGGLDRLGASLKSIAGTISSVVSSLGGLKGVLMVVGAYMSLGFVGSVAGLGVSLLKLVPALIEVNAGLATMGISFSAVLLTAGAVALAIVSIGAAIYELNKHWLALKDSNFEDLAAWFNNVTGGDWFNGGRGESEGETLGRVSRDGSQGTQKRPMFGQPGFRPSLPADRAAPPLSSRQTNDASVTMRFENLPPWARPSVDRGSKGSISLLSGQSMADAQ